VDAAPEDSTAATGLRRRLSSLLAERAHSPDVVCSPEHGHGFLHRLDAPSSGLVLQATCYEGLQHLRIQRELGQVQRDYVALCHGWISKDCEVTARIRKYRGGASRPSLQGRPAQTRLKVLAHLRHFNTPLSLVVITILTGRTHQIRCHLCHIGHPIVADALYGTGRDVAWCGRHFLHRHRLAFHDLDGVVHAAAEPLPLDLCTVLRKLVVVRGGSAVDLWLAQTGAQRSWAEWEGFGGADEVSEPLALEWVSLASRGPKL